MNLDKKSSEVNSSMTNNMDDIVTPKNTFDQIADFFEKMTIGIFRFARKMLVWLKCNIWQIITAIIRYVRAMGRLIFWIAIWLFSMLLGFVVFSFDRFINFGVWIYNKLIHLVQVFIPHFLKHIFPFLKEHGGEIWLAVAALGSLYGILYVPIKRRTNISFKSIFSWLKKKKSDETSADNKKE